MSWKVRKYVYINSFSAPSIITGNNYYLIALTSNIFSNNFTYNLRTPKDFPIEARNIIANKNIKNGVTSIEHETLTTLHTNAILLQVAWQLQQPRTTDVRILSTSQINLILMHVRGQTWKYQTQRVYKQTAHNHRGAPVLPISYFRVGYDNKNRLFEIVVNWGLVNTLNCRHMTFPYRYIVRYY